MNTTSSILSIISLKNQREFDEVNAAGQKIHGKFFIAIRSKQSLPHQQCVYLGLKVSRKMGNAVKRNKIKRWFREIIRKLAHEDPKYLGLSFILIPKKSIASTNFQALLEDFKNNLLT